MEEGPLLDVALVAAAQKIEHYEIAAYGTLCALLKAAGHQEAAELLGQTLQEEKDTDERLTLLAEREINPAAMRGKAANDPSDRDSSAA
jgi:ferritin-like metal-binding protein YciE